MAVNSELSLTLGVRDLLDAGLHFGHQSKRWNPKMKRFIFAKRNGITIIDLAKTLVQLKAAQQFVHDTVAGGRQMLFVGTKKACQEPIKEIATRTGQHYIISRWLGGILTNHRNVASSIRHMRSIETLEQEGKLASMPQKEASRLRHELIRLQRNLGGIANMQDMPGALIVVDLNREAIAVKEANRMKIPVVALVDTNCDPDLVQHPIPGNDDAIRGIRLVLNVLADAIVKASADYAVAAAKLKEARDAAEKVRAAQAESQQRARRERRPRRNDARPRDKAAPAAAAPAPDKPSEPAAAAPAPQPEKPAP